MKQSALKNIESSNVISILLITLVMALIAGTVTNVSALSSPDARLLEPQTTDQESQQTDVRELKVGQTVERELAGGGSHFYRVALTVGQYMKVVVEQKGIDVVVRWFGPDGKQLAEVDSPNGTQGPEPVSTIAEAAGEYRLEVKALDEKAAPGRYELKVEELRESTANDRDRIAAELARAGALADAEQLRAKGTAESLRKAIERYDEALPLLRKLDDRRGEALILTIIGSVYWRIGENRKALDYYTQALPIWNALGDRLEAAKTLNNFGTAYSQLGDFQKALEYFNQSLPILHAVGDRQEEATTLYNAGLGYLRLGDSQKALEYFNQALRLKRIVGDHQGEAAALVGIGLTYDHLGKLQEALQYFSQALPLSHTAGDRRTEASTLHNIGATYTRLGEMQKALEYYHRALPLSHDRGDRLGEASTLDNIGVLYWELGENQRALEKHNEALTLRRATGDRNGEFMTLHNIGAVHQSLGEPQRALEYYNQALSLSRVVGNRFWQANLLQSIGVVHQLLGEPQKALDSLNQALLLRRAVGDRWGEAKTLSLIGESYSLLGKPKEALSYLEQALPMHRALGDRPNESRTLQRVARVEQAQGRSDKALAQMEAALNIIESMRSKLINQELRTSFSASRQGSYDFYIDLLMTMHRGQTSAQYDVLALQASERARARGLLELLAEARIDVKQGIAPALKQREKELQARISWVQSQIIKTISSEKPDQAKVDSLEKEFKKLDSEREQMETEIRQKHPRYATLHHPEPLDLKAVQQLLDENTVLLEYSLGKEASTLFAISKDDFRAARLPAASAITNQVTALREAIAIKPDRIALSNYLQKARSLYEDLIQPANKLLEGKKALIIVPDGILHYLPFAVLLQSDTGRQSQTNLHRLPYLINNYAISYAPSATVLADLRSLDRTTKAPGVFLAFADPVYGKTEAEQTIPVRSAVGSAFGEAKPWELKQLPETRREVEQIAKLYSPSQVNVFLGEQATEENVKDGDRLSQYRIVHFALHGLLNENKPQYSGVILSLPRTSKENGSTSDKKSAELTNAGAAKIAHEDGLLQVYEIFNLKLNADLVVLSACETGLGKEIRGEGLVGLSQAFFYAGTPSLSMSLWKVQDRSTGDLMVRFYRNLKSPMLNKSEALRQAQLEMIRKGDFSHPYHWAGFVLIGQP